MGQNHYFTTNGGHSTTFYRTINSAAAVLLFFLPFGFNISAQTMQAGGWRTSNDTKYTCIACTNNLTSKIYRINCTEMVDNDVLLFNLIVDGAIIPTNFQEGSYVIVEGKNIAIQQVTDGKMINGSWAIIQQPEIVATNVPWSFMPASNTNMLIASLKTEQEFLLSIDNNSPQCTNASFTVHVDGQPLRDTNNNIMKFLAGSTVHGKGKDILIRAYGTCTIYEPVRGSLQLKK